LVIKWVISPTYKRGIPWGYNLLILTFDPNFQRDILVVGWQGASLPEAFLSNFVSKNFDEKMNRKEMVGPWNTKVRKNMEP